MNSYIDLANGIVVLAAKDYRKALKTLKKTPDNLNAKVMKEECERFFGSKWFTELTDANGDYIADRIRREM